MYEVAVQRDWDFSLARALDRTGPSKMVKKHEALRADKYATDNSMGFPGSLNNGE